MDVEAAAAAAVEDIKQEEWDLDAIEKRKEQQVCGRGRGATCCWCRGMPGVWFGVSYWSRGHGGGGEGGEHTAGGMDAIEKRKEQQACGGGCGVVLLVSMPGVRLTTGAKPLLCLIHSCWHTHYTQYLFEPPPPPTHTHTHVIATSAFTHSHSHSLPSHTPPPAPPPRHPHRSLALRTARRWETHRAPTHTCL